ncbi:MAG: hypothetical protein J6J42_12240 [Lachnospiraceae bacterium]|nr:hypothetical protein [Lachnospiraceae bacterium]
MKKRIITSIICLVVLFAGCNKVDEQTVIPTSTPKCIPTIVDAAEPTVEPANNAEATIIPEEEPIVTIEAEITPSETESVTVVSTEIPVVTEIPADTSGVEAATNTPTPTPTNIPTPEPTETSTPTPTLEPTNTPIPTNTPVPTEVPAPTTSATDGVKYIEYDEYVLLHKDYYGTEHYDGEKINQSDFQKVNVTVTISTQLHFYDVRKYTIGYVKPGVEAKIVFQSETWTQIVVGKKKVFVRTEELENSSTAPTATPTPSPKPTAPPRPTSTPKPTATPRPTATPTPTPKPEWLQGVYFNDYDEEEQWTGTKPDNNHTYAEAMEIAELFANALKEAGYSFSKDMIVGVSAGVGVWIDYDYTYEEIVKAVEEYIENEKERKNLYIWPYDKFRLCTVWSRVDGYSVDFILGREGEKLNRTPEEAQALIEKAFYEIGFQNYWDVYDELPEYMNPSGSYSIGPYDIYEDLLNDACRYKKAGWRYVFFEYVETKKDGTIEFKIQCFE